MKEKTSAYRQSLLSVLTPPPPPPLLIAYRTIFSNALEAESCPGYLKSKTQVAYEIKFGFIDLYNAQVINIMHDAIYK